MIIGNPNGWKREVLVIGGPTYIRELESKFLTALDAAKTDMSYNVRNGSGAFHTVGMPRSEKQVKMMKERNPSFRAEVVEKLRVAGKQRDVSHLQAECYKEKRLLGQKQARARGCYVGVGFKPGDENIAKTPEVRAKIAAAMKNIHGGRMTGKKHSPETRAKMAASRRLYWERKRSNAGKNYTV